MLRLWKQQPLSNHSSCLGLHNGGFSWRPRKRRGGQEVLQLLISAESRRPAAQGMPDGFFFPFQKVCWGHGGGAAGLLLCLAHAWMLGSCWTCWSRVCWSLGWEAYGRNRTFGFAAADTLLRGPQAPLRSGGTSFS